MSRLVAQPNAQLTSIPMQFIPRSRENTSADVQIPVEFLFNGLAMRTRVLEFKKILI